MVRTLFSAWFDNFWWFLNYSVLFLVAHRQDILGQFSMVNLELFNIVEDIKKVSKAFVVHPKNVNAENAASTNFFSTATWWIIYLLFLLWIELFCLLYWRTPVEVNAHTPLWCMWCEITLLNDWTYKIYPFLGGSWIDLLSFPAVLPVMLSSKLLPEMEIDDNSKREQLLLGMQNLPVSMQIEKLKVPLLSDQYLSLLCSLHSSVPFFIFHRLELKWLELPVKVLRRS